MMDPISIEKSSAEMSEKFLINESALLSVGSPSLPDYASNNLISGTFGARNERRFNFVEENNSIERNEPVIKVVEDSAIFDENRELKRRIEDIEANFEQLLNVTAKERMAATKKQRDLSNGSNPSAKASTISKYSKYSKKSMEKKTKKPRKTSTTGGVRTSRTGMPKSRSQLGLRKNEKIYAETIISDNVSDHTHRGGRCFRRDCKFVHDDQAQIEVRGIAGCSIGRGASTGRGVSSYSYSSYSGGAARAGCMRHAMADQCRCHPTPPVRRSDF